MTYKLVASGGRFDLPDEAEVSYLETLIGEGQKARLEIDTQWTLPTWQMNALRETLASQGVQDLRVSSNSPTLTIEFRKGFPWLLIIVLAVLALAILIIAWRLLVELPVGGDWLFIAAVALLGIALISRK